MLLFCESIAATYMYVSTMILSHFKLPTEPHFQWIFVVLLLLAQNILFIYVGTLSVLTTKKHFTTF